MAQEPYLSDKLFQIAYVVPDLHATIRFFKEKLGVPDFLVLEDVNLQDQTYYGKPSNNRQSISFGYCGEMQIEVIQPLAGPSTYVDFLERNPSGGVQHLGHLVEDYDAAVAQLTAQGYRLVQSGRNGDTRFGYFDTDAPTGTLTEVVYIAPAERAGLERLKRRPA